MQINEGIIPLPSALKGKGSGKGGTKTGIKKPEPKEKAVPATYKGGDKQGASKSQVKPSSVEAQIGEAPSIPVTPEPTNTTIAGFSDFYNGKTSRAFEGGGNPILDWLRSILGGGEIPLPREFTSEGMTHNAMQQGGGRMNLAPEDMFNTENIDYLLRNSMNMGGNGGRANITWEDIVNYLPDNYAWLYPEYSAFMQNDIPLPGGGEGGGGGGQDYTYEIPGWGGGGYGNNKGYYGSDLVNWRI